MIFDLILSTTMNLTALQYRILENAARRTFYGYELAEQLGIAKKGMATHFNQLEKEGIIDSEYVPRPHGGRPLRMIHVTEKGAFLLKAKKKFEAM